MKLPAKGYAITLSICFGILLCGSAFAACEGTNPKELSNRDTVGIIGGSVRGTYSRFTQDMADVLDRECELRVVPFLGKGSVQNLTDLLYLKGVDVAIVQSDAFSAFLKRDFDTIEDIRTKIKYIAKLYNEEIHVLAGPNIDNVRDLNNETVSIGSPGSGTIDTARIVFEQLDIPITPIAMANSDAVAAVRNGEIAAAVFVAGAPASYFNDVREEDGLRFLKVEIDRNLEREGYISSFLTSEQYPEVVSDDSKVETIAVGAVLAVYNWKPSSSRHQRVQLFARKLFDNLKTFQTSDAYHPKWREVDPSLPVPGWDRLQVQ